MIRSNPLCCIRKYMLPRRSRIVSGSKTSADRNRITDIVDERLSPTAIPGNFRVQNTHTPRMDPRARPSGFVKDEWGAHETAYVNSEPFAAQGKDQE